MKLPEHYKNLDAEQKRTVIVNLISEFWNENIQERILNFNDDQINFLFTYFFTESKEKRDRMRDDMRKEYETTIEDLKEIAKKLQNLDLEFSELLAQKEDKDEFMRNIR